MINVNAATLTSPGSGLNNPSLKHFTTVSSYKCAAWRRDLDVGTQSKNMYLEDDALRMRLDSRALTKKVATGKRKRHNMLQCREFVATEWWKVCMLQSRHKLCPTTYSGGLVCVCVCHPEIGHHPATQTARRCYQDRPAATTAAAPHAEALSYRPGSKRFTSAGSGVWESELSTRIQSLRTLPLNTRLKETIRRQPGD